MKNVNEDLEHKNVLAHLITRLSQTGEVRFDVSVSPRAKVTAIKDVFENGVIKISINKPADQNKANTELIRFLAQTFGVPQLSVSIIRGQTSRSKTIHIVI